MVEFRKVGNMAVNISGSQIYAGRYHYQETKTPDLLDNGKYVACTPRKSVKDVAKVEAGLWQ